jgi:hypothetical protein
MFPNDDLRKDVQSWKFVELSDQIAQVLGFENADRVKEICQDVDFNDVRVPIHYDMLHDDVQESFFSNCDSDFLKPVVSISPDNEYEVITSLEFLGNEFSNLEHIEIFEILTDQ